MRRRLIASYLTITVITLLALVYPLGRTFASRERDRLLREIEQDATVVAGLSEDALEEGIPPDLDEVLRDYRRDPGGRIVVVDSSGRTVADSDRPGSTGVDFTNRPEVVTALGGATAEGSRRSETLGADLVYVAVPVASGGQVHGAVRITYPSSTLDARIEAAWVGLATVSAAVMVAVTAVGFALARLVTRPVDRLKDAAEQLAGGDLSARAPTDSGAPELRELATTFNATAERLQEVMDAQQAFVGDASHQLRTPLAALRLKLENIESTAPAALRPALASALAETARLARISEGLLVLTRSAADTVAPVVIDVAAVARDRQQAWAPVAAESDVTLLLDAVGPVAVHADPGALEQILDNLVDNALSVAPAASTVRMSIHAGAAAGMIEVHVVDQGAGLTAEQRSRALDRFWRGPAAEPGGTGLGLAIVAQLAGRCGGRAELREADGGGIDAVVTLLAAEFDDDAGTFTSG